ncbi:hypothetical protein LTR37_020277 [Vermiconidia calcicola]|uniref:Uncharacterized protein n=1 Tax=Vermiconidia calcicola TaxID=1690605 RepID=A0ACC3MBQ4_9PEZI|nr:hypothetical protein LTR37_020277 [Vermiconidia calcicola]
MDCCGSVDELSEQILALLFPEIGTAEAAHGSPRKDGRGEGVQEQEALTPHGHGDGHADCNGVGNEEDGIAKADEQGSTVAGQIAAVDGHSTPESVTEAGDAMQPADDVHATLETLEDRIRQLEERSEASHNRRIIMSNRIDSIQTSIAALSTHVTALDNRVAQQEQYSVPRWQRIVDLACAVLLSVGFMLLVRWLEVLGPACGGANAD